MSEGPKLRRKARLDHDARRKAFIRAAAEVFSENGLHKGTMDQVAERTGVSKVVLYRTFPSKAELLAAIAEEAFEHLQRAATEPWRGYGSGLRRALQAMRAWPDGFIVVLRDMPSAPDCATHYEKFALQAQRDLMGLIPEDYLRSQHARETAFALASAMAALIHQAVRRWIEVYPPDEDEQLIAWAASLTQAWRKATLQALAATPPPP